MFVGTLFTSESVSGGHPDKLADQLSDTVLDSCLERNPRARVACETLVKGDLVLLAGELDEKLLDPVALEARLREVIRHVGYDRADRGMDADHCEVQQRLSPQSGDIKRGVDRDGEQGAGDQGMMFGYACQETDTLMPAPIEYAHRLMRRQAQVRRQQLDWLGPDAKSQVTVRYRDGQPIGLAAVVLSTQHDEGVQTSALHDAVREEILRPVLPEAWLQDPALRVHINPTGRFVKGGPGADCGLTGRKIIVDTYGGMARHGGGAFSGKDPSKVDRSAAYAARYVAKNIVAAGLAGRCEVQLSYAIGVAEPISVSVQTFGTAAITEAELVAAVGRHFDLRPAGIIEMLQLLRPIYAATAAYGHFGREDFPWERTDRVEALRADFERSRMHSHG